MILGQDYADALTDVPTQMLIAPVLPTMVSDRAYAVGEQFIVNSVLYKITQAVSAAGVALVVGTNCAVSDTISQQIKNITTITSLLGNISSGTCSIQDVSRCKAQKMGNLVNINCIYVHIDADIPYTSTSVMLSGFPAPAYNGEIRLGGAKGDGVVKYVKINASGNMVVDSVNNIPAGNYYFSGDYFA